MKILSWNVNGLRAVCKKGFLNWFRKADADILCLQEIKAQKEQLPDELSKIKDYYFYLNTAIKKGYSGTAIYSKRKPVKIKNKLGFKRFDNEARMLQLDYPNFVLLNLYLPHGGRQKENLNYKLEVYEILLNYIQKYENIILIGDFNIAHQEIDLARPKNNQNNIMFTSKEREQISKLIKLGYADSFRKFNQQAGNYSWWPYSFNCRKRNLGWRLDYAFTSKSLLPKLRNAFILPQITGSDHCPIGIEI